MISCMQCESLVHAKCSLISRHQLLCEGTPLNWRCLSCMNNILPFSMLDDHELKTLNFNSLYDCNCKSNFIDEPYFLIIEKLQLNESVHNENSRHSRDDIDHQLPSTNDFDYYDGHKFHKLLNNKALNIKNSLSIVHTNICSLLKHSVELEIGKFMYSVENKLLDSFFLGMFQKTNDRHTRCTRQATRNDFVIPKTKLSIVRRSIRYVGAITWNSIPGEIKNSKTKAIFSKKFSKYLQQKY